MRILVVTQYFWPENFKINDFCLGLKERGHDVTVLTGIPNYPKGKFYDNYSFWKNNDEKWNGIKIYRSKLFSRGDNGIRLMLNYGSFVLFGTLKSLFIKEKFDKIFVFEPSPVTVGLPAMFVARRMKIPYYFWVQDLWPESLSAAGGINNKTILSFFDKITRSIYKSAEKVLVQSEGFIDYIVKQGIAREKIIYYPNSTESFYKPVASSEVYQQKMPKDGLKILFAGNLGEAQSLDTLVDAAKILKDKKIKVNWILLGDGRQKEHLVSEIKRKGLVEDFHLLGSYPSEEMPLFFGCVDALVVSLKKNKIFALTIPSKLQSYMACGKPIIASLEGEGARIVEESKSGFVSPPDDADGLAESIIKLYNADDKQRTEMSQNGLKYFNEQFERELLLDKLIEILKQ
ncbi:glycosyltransferase involved in cell wall biosynthesis [Flavobacterium chryseum]|uniref:glycosyltransferase family 4 protein n=1 Tax=Flavobacterium sp. P3160 TaxID=2512113 RepID=UPI00105B4B3F|nr:glycosyltransferase family 4 protein [Flavobacterium sp. P3160]TDO77451.1 glycosyltransferase involved in cell wall biosynthesis [Flavobacterium sp. P3160]